MRALLDVSTLVALHDPHHVHHRLAFGWLEHHLDEGWATCPLTQNGCLRVMNQPAYLHPLPIAVLWPLLAASFASLSHAFWPDELSLFDANRFRVDRIDGHRQLTDLYLLALAVNRGGRFVTLDRRVPLHAVRGAEQRHLVALAEPPPPS